MDESKIYTAIGLMSGTSMDGVDVALIKTDGQVIHEFGPSLTIPYQDAFKDSLRRVLGPAGRAQPGVADVEHDLTMYHADAVKALLDRAGLDTGSIDIVGFHGHTVHHDPKNAITLQLGDGQTLANWLGIAVACDFRSRDVAAGGEGAPLVPVFHAALVRSHQELPMPAAVVNIGGVANVTWVGWGHDGGEEILAFDTGPGNARLNDWVRVHTGKDMDRGGELAAKGHVDEKILTDLMAHEYFKRVPPKSIDRQEFCRDCTQDLSLEDGAATITAFIVRSIAASAEYFPAPVQSWVITGGGRHNPEIMKGLRATLKGTTVRTADGLGWDGDAMEAQAFAYLAVRAARGLPISFPTTTGVAEPMAGGQVYKPQ